VLVGTGAAIAAEPPRRTAAEQAMLRTWFHGVNGELARQVLPAGSGSSPTGSSTSIWIGSQALQPHAFFYYVRAENDCGAGPLGFSSNGAPRTGAPCP